MSSVVPHVVTLDGSARSCRPTTLRKQGKDEAFLERVIGEHPELLGLDALDTGVHGRLVAFHQLVLPTPHSADRQIRPDIIFLAESGDVVVVEVKLEDNQELKDRRVVAQVIEYAACLALLEEDRLAALFCQKGAMASSWLDAVRLSFPETGNVQGLARKLLDNIKQARIHLVIASDGASPGLLSLAASVSRQHALGDFVFRIVELCPFLAPDGSQLLLIPQNRLETEIVARTLVQVEVNEGHPHVKVEMTSTEEIAASVERTRNGRRKSPWTAQEFRQQLAAQSMASHEKSLLVRAADLFERLEKDGVIQIDGGTGQAAQIVARAGVVNLVTLGVQPQVKLYTWSWNQFERLESEMRKSMAQVVGEVVQEAREPNVLPELLERDPELQRLEGWIREWAGRAKAASLAK